MVRVVGLDSLRRREAMSVSSRNTAPVEEVDRVPESQPTLVEKKTASERLNEVGEKTKDLNDKQGVEGSTGGLSVKQQEPEDGVKTDKDVPDVDQTVFSRKDKFRRSSKRSSFFIREGSKTRVKTKFPAASLESIAGFLEGVIFSGWLQERKLVTHLNAYRDVIEVDEWEEEFNLKLKSVIASLLGTNAQKRWINITGPDESCIWYSLWVLFEEIPFPGHYWFKVNKVTSEADFGLRVYVSILRPIHTFDGESLSMRERRRKGVNFSLDEWKEWVDGVTNLDFRSMGTSILATLSPSNISSGIRLVIILAVTLCVALATFLKQVWTYMLKFMREFGIFIHHATPFLQSVVGFFEKIVGGFYMLIAMVYRDFRQPTRPPAPPSYLQNGANQRSLTYVPQQSWSYQN